MNNIPRATQVAVFVVLIVHAWILLSPTYWLKLFIWFERNSNCRWLNETGLKKSTCNILNFRHIIVRFRYVNGFKRNTLQKLLIILIAMEKLPISESQPNEWLKQSCPNCWSGNGEKEEDKKNHMKTPSDFFLKNFWTQAWELLEQSE